jgi:hypothetical protein
VHLPADLLINFIAHRRKRAAGDPTPILSVEISAGA